MTGPGPTSQRLEEIRRVWTLSQSALGVSAYSDEGCRSLAALALYDVPDLLAALDARAQALAAAIEAIREADSFLSDPDGKATDSINYARPFLREALDALAGTVGGEEPGKPKSHEVEMGDDGMIHCRTCKTAWWPHDPGRKMPDYTCDGEEPG